VRTVDAWNARFPEIVNGARKWKPGESRSRVRAVDAWNARYLENREWRTEREVR
jgi:hypothetical protein